MRRAIFYLLGALTVTFLAASSAFAARAAVSRTSLGFVAGGGLPTGWWGERWGPFECGEINLRYEFSSGTGVLFLVGLDKTYFIDMSKSEVAQDSKFRDLRQDFAPYAKINQAVQDGSFKQLPVGFGFYREQMIAGYRAYGSAAFAVHLWRFERGQRFTETVTPPGSDTLRFEDNWWDEQDGSNVGLQFAAGVLYPLKTNLQLDFSIAYHLVSLTKDNAALAYWGKPMRVRNFRPEVKATTKTSANFLLVRLGVRFGK
jgi:hypothetical protein